MSINQSIADKQSMTINQSISVWVSRNNPLSLSSGTLVRQKKRKLKWKHQGNGGMEFTSLKCTESWHVQSYIQLKKIRCLRISNAKLECSSWGGGGRVRRGGYAPLPLSPPLPSSSKSVSLLTLARKNNLHLWRNSIAPLDVAGNWIGVKVTWHQFSR